LKSVNRISNLKEKLCAIDESHGNTTHIVIEKFKRGDIFGIYSALKHQKNNYSSVALSEKVSIYKIAKAHILLYFGGSSGNLPNTLKGIDSVQQNSLKEKLDFLLKSSLENSSELKRFEYKSIKDNEFVEQKIIVDETPINNYLKDAWKELENLDAKVQSFKTNLFNKPVKEVLPSSNIVNKIKEKDIEFKDHSKVMGFGTNRVVSNKLNKTNLSTSQLKGMNMLKSICDVKKKPSIVEEKKDGNMESKEEKKEERKPNRLKNLMALDSMAEVKQEERMVVDEAKEKEIIITDNDE